MNVSEAVASRCSIRDFLPTPVTGATIRQVLAAASRSPSGGNVQPWHIDVIAGSKLDELKALMRQRVLAIAGGGDAEERDYDIYPKDLPTPYRDYRFKLGEDMYALVGIGRDDKAGRLRWFARNWEAFGAPMLLLCSVDRRMGKPQWSDLGMFLQTVMLLLREQGLDSCAQESWSVYPRTVGSFIGLPPERMIFAGMAVGYRNPEHAVNSLHSDRAPLETFARFHGI